MSAFALERAGIRRTAVVEGIGLHFGEPCRLEFRPAPAGSGIAFRRLDLPGTPLVPASIDGAVATDRRTQLGEGDAACQTVEHVLAAVVGAGIDDVEIALSAAEPPIADGSAAPFVQALAAAGRVPTGRPATVLRLLSPVEVTDGASTYRAEPAPALSLDVSINFAHPLVGAQRLGFVPSVERFRDEIATARTFGFVHEVEALRAAGLIKGGSTANAVVLDETGVVDGTLRAPDEFVRHKVLDLIGDLALAGGRVLAHIRADRPSHRGTQALVRALVRKSRLESPVITIDDILQVLPHRYPFLLVDRILEIEDGKRAVGLKNVTINEPFFQGHFPGHPIMPGVLIIESMAQVGGMLLMRTVPEPATKVVYFMSLDNVKFRRPVKPGDQLRIEVEVLRLRGTICSIKGVARVDGDVVCEAEMAAIMRDR
ncbi:MAG: UDP-3-O-acyl-N-acetylglucosamine deacetylase [Gemmatimonadaceae bacterium]|nr:UDP-3-O-acyl-N-acetylglucosamine deacetylase [Gemmatimonadaceae bacterium]